MTRLIADQCNWRVCSSSARAKCRECVASSQFVTDLDPVKCSLPVPAPILLAPTLHVSPLLLPAFGCCYSVKDPGHAHHCLVHAPTLPKADLLKNDWPARKSACRTGAGFASPESRIRALDGVTSFCYVRPLSLVRSEKRGASWIVPPTILSRGQSRSWLRSTIIGFGDRSRTKVVETYSAVGMRADPPLAADGKTTRPDLTHPP